MFPTIAAALDQITTTQLASLGTTYVSGLDQARRTYRYVAFPASTATVSGVLLTAAAAPANSTALAISAANSATQLLAGSKSIIITNGTTTVTTNQFADGMLEVLGTNGIGQSYRITGNTSATSGLAITVSLSDPLRNVSTLVAGTNTVNLRVSPYSLPVAQTTQSLPVGVTIMPVVSNTAVQYGWVQTGGQVYVNATSGTKGFNATQDIATNAGNVANSAASTTADVGTFIESASSSLASVYLSINAS